MDVVMFVVGTCVSVSLVAFTILLVYIVYGFIKDG